VTLNTGDQDAGLACGDNNAASDVDRFRHQGLQALPQFWTQSPLLLWRWRRGDVRPRHAAVRVRMAGGKPWQVF